MSTGSTLAESFERALALVDGRLGAPRAALILADGSQRVLAIEAAHGMPCDALRLRYGAGVVGRVATMPIVIPVVHGEPMALSELTEPSAWPEARLSLVCVPLIVERRCVGALSVYFAPMLLCRTARG